MGDCCSKWALIDDGFRCLINDSGREPELIFDLIVAKLQSRGERKVLAVVSYHFGDRAGCISMESRYDNEGDCPQVRVAGDDDDFTWLMS